MRVSREVAEQNRKSVVDTASRLFRENGYDGIGVAALMKAAGLTHGGFYKQFEDKAALAAEATEAALAGNREKWSGVIATAGQGKDITPAAALAAWYLSPQHAGMRAEGCAFAALASEAPRQPAPVRAAFTSAIEESVALLTAPDTPRDEALRHLSAMVGALVLARATDDPGLADDILSATRASLR
ncbi:TetR family transcriptional regulator [Primorskyibacter flagellatus]|uniref:TetR family transcriptional regulator n=2 Tax=Primorskyibacter flagellatus TaxID=1387277 RepID=A0A917EHT9_9RHOB|nr:TetR family transcriptional regulator [Primorskyibacter flagellatus]